ncbi:MAG: chemotaxis protein methyltransferase CheR [Thermovirga sp.]|jgi:chemotaxis protein methyltransferase CheR|nr:chemotaxis protein methyltransferase CheR [Thermovirga sp.]MDN5368145.1 chemotaxis protein methyltransferase CheR [Thermovirga sp.]
MRGIVVIGGTVVEEKVYPAGEGYDLFKKKVAQLTGIDLNIYKYQIHRRVHTLMRNWNISSYEDYYDLIKKDEEKRREFLDYITINVTEFFRNPNRWDCLRDKILPELKDLAGNRPLKMMSAGCSSGEEPYSLAIMATECNLKFEVVAVDVDEGILKKAKEGVYKEEQLINISSSVKNKYFEKLGPDKYRIKDVIKSNVKFKKLNLLEDSLPKGFHLVLCRNVVIYFSAETKEKLYRDFNKILLKGGYLMLGPTEQIFGYESMGFKYSGFAFYKKVAEAEQVVKVENR